MTEVEFAAIAEVERKLLAPEFVHQAGGLQRPGVKIHEDVYVVESGVGDHRVTARLRSGRIEALDLFGPVGSDQQTDGLAASLRGIELSPETVQLAVDEFFRGRTDAAQATEWAAALSTLPQITRTRP